jgi:aromatic-L-amino-acid decarboxylase
LSALEPSDAELEAWLAACARMVREHAATSGDRPASDLDGADDLADTFREPAPREGTSLDALLARLQPAFDKSLHTAGPGYLAFIPGGGLPSCAIADLIALSYNRFVGVSRAAPALAAIERTAVRWLADIAGYPASARGVLTTGGSISNLVAMVTARIEMLGDDIARGVVYASEETHHSVAKAARIAGLVHVRRVAVDDRLRISVDSLAAAIEADRKNGFRPFLIVANAGTTNTGAIDPLDAICDLADRERLWVHCDGAYGGLFRMVDACKMQLNAIARCASVTLDVHKTMFAPYGTGCVLVRDGAALKRAHATGAAYLADVAARDDEDDFADLSPELSREFRGLRVWLPVMLHGMDAFVSALEEKLRLTALVHESLAADPRFELLDSRPQLTVVAFRLRNASDEENRALLARVNARKRVYLSSTVVRDRFWLRIAIMSFRTHEDRVREAIEIVRSC